VAIVPQSIQKKRWQTRRTENGLDKRYA